MRRLLVTALPLFFLVSCVTSDIATQILYDYSGANSQYKVPSTPPEGLQEIDVKNGNSETLGWYYVSTNPNAPVLIFFHGNGDNIASLYDGFTQIMQSWNVNYAVFDYPNYGLSKGEMNEAGVLASGQAVIDFMKNRFPGKHIIIWGRSLGCAPATNLAAANQGLVTKLVLTSPWDEFWREIQFKVSSLSDQSCKDAAQGNEWLSDVSSQSITMPVLIHHGTVDKVVSFNLGQHLSQTFANNSKNVTFIPVPGLDHNNIFTAEVLSQIQQFVTH